MRLVIIVTLIFSVILFTRCLPQNSEDKLQYYKNEFYLKETSFREVAMKGREIGYLINYLDKTDVKLANSMEARQIKEEQIEWFRRKMEEIGVEVSIGMYDGRKVVSFGMWSQGIVTGGEAIVIYNMPIPIYQYDYYKRRNKKGTMNCQTLKDEWYICNQN